MLRPKLVILSMSALAAAETAEARTPGVELAPPGLLERHCESLGNAPPQGSVEQVRTSMTAFRGAWRAEGQALLDATVAVTGRPFGFAEAVATLHVCPGLGSLSAPLLIDAGRYFEAESGDGSGTLTPRELGHFVHALWHELMHRQVGDLIGRGAERRSAVLSRYHAESPVTLSHVHLFAVEQLVYRRLGRESEFHARGRAYGLRGNEAYARAYEIVQAEGAEVLVAELSGPPAT